MNELPTTSPSQDASDVAATLRGDAHAYARIIKRHQATVAARMRRFTRSQADIELLAHDVFVEAFVSLRSYRAAAPLEHWLQRIATRVGYRFWKRRKRHEHLPMEQADSVASGSADTTIDSIDQLDVLLAKLSPRDRLVVTLLYVEQRPVKEAAELSGWSQAMVKVQAFRARGKLRKLLADQDDVSSGVEQ